jgi:hypothetical protein
MSATMTKPRFQGTIVMQATIAADDRNTAAAQLQGFASRLQNEIGVESVDRVQVPLVRDMQIDGNVAEKAIQTVLVAIDVEASGFYTASCAAVEFAGNAAGVSQATEVANAVNDVKRAQREVAWAERPEHGMYLADATQALKTAQATLGTALENSDEGHMVQGVIVNYRVLDTRESNGDGQSPDVAVTMPVFATNA